MPEQLRLLHVSDIHFNKRDRLAYDPYDLDVDLRDQLEADVQRIGANFSQVDGIIVNGDVAFAGREPEYEVAFTWLRRLSQLCGCPPEAVWCVPGNHDVDRTVYDKSLNLKNLHNTLRPADPDHIDALLGEALRDSEAAGVLFRPLEQYNRFAAKFRCPALPAPLWWEHDLPLNDGSLLRLHGANSTLVSDSTDDNKARKLILGTLQGTPREQQGVSVAFICHHPLDWLMDYDKLIPNLNARAHVQLFGHKHLQAVEVTNNCLRIVAGAIQPDRREPRWKPRYNWLGFSVVGSGTDRKLEVDVYPRMWSEHEPKFIADYALCGGGAEHRVFRLDLPPWQAPTSPPAVSPDPRPAAPVKANVPPNRTGGATMNPAKTLTYRFLSLPHLVRLEIAQSMNLLREEDEGLFDAELLDRILKRAADAKRLAELWDQVEVRYGDRSYPTNPYVGA